ncbi:DUF1203 domain-containing protein [Saccharomonospora cyanea]|uniref:DUF1203 domain-containing protein n=1 Tax=Saccharomonospora cyanea NA-134 TaxID=882082 RepID=H5XDZ3_9PSEU|nr:DUF1203 domain-containing protein [Saccharomonospora cyanea]EHR59224.1 Protein of unknown function (DUF1203) [Saccharomonospora cyanea NA-134]
MGFRIVPMDTALADEVRTTLRAPGYGHPAWREVPTEAAPCRVCLDAIEPGREALIAFTYDPFREREDVPLPGPVFVHERRCEPYAEPGVYPARLGRSGLLLNCYGDGRRLVLAHRVAHADAEPALDELLARPDVDYIHVRSATAGCYLCTALPD